MSTVCRANPLKHRFLDIAQVAFWAGQKAENEFAGPDDPLKYRFLALSLHILGRPDGRKGVCGGTVGCLFEMIVTVHTFTIFILVGKSYRVLVMLVCLILLLFRIVTTNLLLRRQADKFTPSWY
jgi:hypothetical protein